MNCDEVTDPAQIPTSSSTPPTGGRVVHLQRDRYDVRIDRKTMWGNPFIIGRDGDRGMVIEKYRKWLLVQPELMSAIPGLRGKTLGCWCAPLACHGDILVELANSADQTPPPTGGSHEKKDGYIVLPDNFEIEMAPYALALSKHHPPGDRMGGKREEYTDTRWYDDPNHPRVVNLTITKFSGIGMHFYVDMDEQHDLLLQKEKGSRGRNVWGEPWKWERDTPHWSKKFDTEEEAKAFIVKTLTEHYKSAWTVIFVKSMQTASLHTWFYKEGD